MTDYEEIIVKKPAKMQEVITIKADPKVALVEYVQKGRVFRKYIPTDKLKGNKVAVDELELGMDYGVPWASELKMDATPQQLEDKLHALGLWTGEDVLNKPGALVMSALQAVYGVGLSTIYQVANKYRLKEVKND